MSYGQMGDFADGSGIGILQKFGISAATAQLALPFMSTEPGSMDRHSTSYKVLVQAAQYGLKELGEPILEIDGVVRPATARGLDRLFGGRNKWVQTPWVRILQKIARAVGAKTLRGSSPEALEGYESTGDFGSTGQLVVWGVVGYLALVVGMNVMESW